MKVLVLNLTGNASGWEDAVADLIVCAVKDSGHICEVYQAHGADELTILGQVLASKTCDILLMIAHGGIPNGAVVAQIAVSPPGFEAILNNYHLLSSIFPSLWRNHKVLIICEGLNLDSLAALNVGLPNFPLSSDAVLIAKTDLVESSEAVVLCRELFSDLARRCPRQRPTGGEMRASFNAVVRPNFDGWEIFDALHVTEEEVPNQ